MSNPARTNSAAVQGVLGDDYGPKEDGTLPDLTPYIATASAIVDRVITCATRKGYTLSCTETELIERWLAAHFYAVSDKPYQSRSTEGASGQFSGQTAMGFDANQYGQMAQRVDYSGCLRNLDKQQRAGAAWLGKPASQQQSWQDRNG